MSQTTLFICKSCHRIGDRPPDQPPDGTQLLTAINALHATQPAI